MVMKNPPQSPKTYVKTYVGEINRVPARKTSKLQRRTQEMKDKASALIQKRVKKQAEVRAKRRATRNDTPKVFPGIPNVNKKGVPTLMWRP